MKQHITIKQLNELSEKGKKRLKEWWKPKKNDFYVYDKRFQSADYIFSVDHAEILAKEYKRWGNPILSIGQMIWFLGDGWYWEVFTSTRFDYSIDPLYSGEFCDALWLVVKGELEK